MLMQLVLQGGGTAAGVATFAVLVSIRKDFRRVNRRVTRLERHIWPDVFGDDPEAD